MSGLIGKKVGMTRLYNEDGNAVPCTVIEAGPCTVTQLKTVEKEGYWAVQLGFDEAKEKNTTKPLKGHFKKAGINPVKKLKEFKYFREDRGLKVGDELKVTDIFEQGDVIDITGTSKGKGFQGVVKRYNFGGVGGQTHGQHNRQRHLGSLGPGSYPSRVFKGKKMPGRMGTDTVTVQNLEILMVDEEKNLLVVSGSVPGGKNGYLFIEK